MKSRLLALLSGLLLLCAVILFLRVPPPSSSSKVETTNPQASAPLPYNSNQPSHASTKSNHHPPLPRQGPNPGRPSARLLNQYRPELDSIPSPSDLDELLHNAGYPTLHTDCHAALRGNPHALADIFNAPPTDGSASESFASILQDLLASLGDDYFTFHLARQSPAIQNRHLSLLFHPSSGPRIDASGNLLVYGEHDFPTPCPRLTKLWHSMSEE